MSHIISALSTLIHSISPPGEIIFELMTPNLKNHRSEDARKALTYEEAVEKAGELTLTLPGIYINHELRSRDVSPVHVQTQTSPYVFVSPPQCCETTPRVSNQQVTSHFVFLSCSLKTLPLLLQALAYFTGCCWWCAVGPTPAMLWRSSASPSSFPLLAAT